MIPSGLCAVLDGAGFFYGFAKPVVDPDEPRVRIIDGFPHCVAILDLTPESEDQHIDLRDGRREKPLALLDCCGDRAIDPDGLGVSRPAGWLLCRVFALLQIGAFDVIVQEFRS